MLHLAGVLAAKEGSCAHHIVSYGYQIDEMKKLAISVRPDLQINLKKVGLIKCKIND